MKKFIMKDLGDKKISWYKRRYSSENPYVTDMSVTYCILSNN